MNASPGPPGEPRYPTVEVPRTAAGSRESVVRFLVGELAMPCGVTAEQLENVVGQVLRRETLGSTGIGQGLAIPHVTSDAIAAAGTLVGRLPVPVEWDAIDGEPVRVACLLLSPPNNPGARLKHLEGIVRFLRGYVNGTEQL